MGSVIQPFEQLELGMFRLFKCGDRSLNSDYFSAKAKSESPFTQRKNRLRTCQKSSRDRIILAVYTDDDDGSDKKRRKD